MKTRAVILAGGEGARLSVLTVKRAKPAVPFAGKYRIIDFTLSNCVNSGIFDVMVLVQYRPHSLIRHIGAGGPWDLNRDFTGGVRMLTPYKARSGADWFVGTADAVQQNFAFIKESRPDQVLILSGDHVYAMDYDAMLTFHRDHHADLTMAVIRVPPGEASRFGVVEVGEDYRLKSFVEKPSQPPSDLVNMGVYIFEMGVLDQVLWEDRQLSGSSHDFGQDIIPRMLAEGRSIYAYPYSGYWVDVGTIQSYWHAHMDLLSEPPSVDLNDRDWVIHTRTEERPPMRISHGACVEHSMVCDGVVIEPGACVRHSVLSPGVVVRAGAKVCRSIVLTDTVVGSGAEIHRAILDKRVRVGEKSLLGKDDEAALLTVVGKNSELPPGLVVEAGAILGNDLALQDFPGPLIESGKLLQTGRKPYEI